MLLACSDTIFLFLTLNQQRFFRCTIKLCTTTTTIGPTTIHFHISLTVSITDFGCAIVKSTTRYSQVELCTESTDGGSELQLRYTAAACDVTTYA